MANRFKEAIRRIPIIGPSLRTIYQAVTRTTPVTFQRSEQYWEDRYKSGGNSGAGSYGRLARFKADFLNKFVSDHQVSTIVEFGCGDGAQLALANYPRYTGFDVSPTSVNTCKDKFKGKQSYDFFLIPSPEYEFFSGADLALSLDVIYHLVEEDVFERYMTTLFSSSLKYVIIFAYDFDRKYKLNHERGRQFSAWINSHARDWSLEKIVPNDYPFDPSNPEHTSQSQFYIYVKQ